MWLDVLVFGTPGHQLPATLQGEGFLLEPLTVDHVELDYAAVMDSREMLRIWSGSTWPAEDFTLAENLEDLQRHQREHEEGEAFTFTVLSPDRGMCLGCVYLNPGDRFAGADLSEEAAVVGFWVRQSVRDGDLEQRLLGALLGWLDDEWGFPATFVSARDLDAIQRRIIERQGMSERGRVGAAGRSGTFVLYGA